MFQSQANITTVKPNECIICFQAGNENYKGHRVKDKTGKVVCPTLLSQKCHVCKQTGHTPKYCTVAKLKKKHDTHQKHKSLYQSSTSKAQEATTNTPSSSLTLHYDGEEETKRDTHLYRNSWAAIVTVSPEPSTPPGPPPLQLMVPYDDDDDGEDEQEQTYMTWNNFTQKPSVSNIVYPPSKKPKLKEETDESTIPIVEETKKKPRPKLWSQYESDEEYE